MLSNPFAPCAHTPLAARPSRLQRRLPRQTRIRPWQASDTAELTRFYEALGPDTLRRRFHCAFSGLSPAWVRALTALGGLDPTRVQTVVAAGGSASDAPILAHAGWHRDGPGRAEFALVVADGWQGLGLGESLMTALVRSAAGAGIGQLHASVLGNNAAMLGLLRRLGLHTTADPDDPDLVCVMLELARWPALRRRSMARRTWRALRHCAGASRPSADALRAGAMAWAARLQLLAQREAR